MGTPHNILIRLYQQGDDEGIVKLLKTTFPKWAEFKDPLELWRWKYLHTPLTNYIVVAIDKNKIVGCTHELLFTAKLGSEVTYLSWGDDLAVGTEYRGLGLWNKMRDEKQKTLGEVAKYSYSTTNNPVVVKSWVKRNQALFPFTVTRMMKTKDIDIQLQTINNKTKLLLKLGYFALTTLNKITNMFRIPVKRLGEFQITQIKEFDSRIDSLWLKIKDDYKFIIEKKSETLNWRFTNNDRGNHVKFLAVNGEEVLGYVVVGFKPGSAEGQIEDLIALKERRDVTDALFGCACEFLDDLGINSVFYQVVVGHPYQGVSQRHGFIDTRSRPSISFDYIVNWKQDSKIEIPFLKHTTPSQVCFNYATTI